MKKTTIVSTKNAPAAIGPYSQAVIIGDMLYASGQIPLDPDTGKLVGKTIIQQTSQIMKNIGAVLDAAGTSFENVVKTTCFLTDMNDFSQFNTVYAQYFTGKPARSCVAVKELPKGAMAEVEIIAHL